MRHSFHRFFGLPRLRTPCGRLSLAIFARRLSSILPTWTSHSLLRSSIHLTTSWMPLRWRRWSLWILSLYVFRFVALIVFISVVRNWTRDLPACSAVPLLGKILQALLNPWTALSSSCTWMHCLPVILPLCTELKTFNSLISHPRRFVTLQNLVFVRLKITAF